MSSIPCLVIGAGQAGLAASRWLAERSLDHVVVERGAVANAWSTERWDSLRLLTPNWQTRLPGWSYTGDDPDGYMTMAEITAHLRGYAASFDAPVRTETRVLRVEPVSDGFSVQTDQGRWSARTVVIATGGCAEPVVPTGADRLPPEIFQCSPLEYRNPDALPGAGVLVVGASASGVQIADELAGAGRDVTLAVGRHTRLPRTYRGMDIQWWLDELGILDERWTDVADIERARRAPSLQIVGTPERRTIDLATVADAGVRLVGRLEAIDGPVVHLGDDLRASCARADATLGRLLGRIDAFAARHGLDDEIEPAHRPRPVPMPAPCATVDLRAAGIGAVVWATGLRPRHRPWLAADVFDGRGAIRHDGGVVRDVPGLYVLGLPFLRRRKSTFIDGAGDDAAAIVRHVAADLGALTPAG